MTEGSVPYAYIDRTGHHDGVGINRFPVDPYGSSMFDLCEL